MKKKTKKLVLAKETVRRLEGETLLAAVGGTFTFGVCGTLNCNSQDFSPENCGSVAPECS
jgi:hypothetical protein